MTDEERYLIDLMGYLVLEDVLDQAELGELNRQLDGHGMWDGGNRLGFEVVKRYNDRLVNAGYLHTADRPIRGLIANRSLLPYLAELLGNDLRFDEGQVLLARPGAGALLLHGGGTPWEPGLGYEVRGGQIYGGHMIAAFCLTDALAEHGGFAAVPGSHKANFRCPRDFALWRTSGQWLQRVPVRAGSVILFTDSITHGSWPWTADFERRVVFCRYVAGFVQHSAPTPVADDSRFDDWTDLERRLLSPPQAWRFESGPEGYREVQRPSLESDGAVMHDHSFQIIPASTALRGGS